MARHVRKALLAAVLLALASPAAAAGGGLEIFPDGSKLLLLIALFLLLVWPANKLLWGPLMRVVEERTERIDRARERGQKIAQDADAVFARYQEAVANARTAAESDYKQRLDEARREKGRVTDEARHSAEEEVSKARAEVDGALSAARDELRQQATEVALVAASRALGRELS
jgi:F-type H+-transporting ATPase subunit b